MGTAVIAALALAAGCVVWVLLQRHAACGGGDPAQGCSGRCGGCGGTEARGDGSAPGSDPAPRRAGRSGISPRSQP